MRQFRQRFLDRAGLDLVRVLLLATLVTLALLFVSIYLERRWRAQCQTGLEAPSRCFFKDEELE